MLPLDGHGRLNKFELVRLSTAMGACKRSLKGFAARRGAGLVKGALSPPGTCSAFLSCRRAAGACAAQFVLAFAALPLTEDLLRISRLHAPPQRLREVCCPSEVCISGGLLVARLSSFTDRRCWIRSGRRQVGGRVWCYSIHFAWLNLDLKSIW